VARARARGLTPAGLVMALLGLALFAWSVRSAGTANIIDGIRRTGWGFLAILALSSARQWLRSFTWSLCTEPPARIPVSSALPAYLVGDALGNLTPLGLLVSEPAKAMFVRHRAALVPALSALAIENLFTASVSRVWCWPAPARCSSASTCRRRCAWRASRRWAERP
jgi:hypothetical protein